jgi:hypothetical protein
MPPRLTVAVIVLLTASTGRAVDPPFRLAPALALEAEDFQVESGWKVIRCVPGHAADGCGANHVSGERLLGLDEKDTTAVAFLDVTIPEAGAYRLWVRYACPPLGGARFRVVVRQDGKAVLDHVIGTKESPPSDQGAGGLVDEAVGVPELKAGPAHLELRGAAQPQAPGMAARRNIDLVYLTRDDADAWRKHYAKQNSLYPILDAFRDTRGPRYEVRFTNKGDRPADFSIAHVYNRVPWGIGEGEPVRGVAPGGSSPWVGLRAQDTAHFGCVRLTSSGQPFAVEIRPAGGAVESTLTGPGPLLVYLPPYPGRGEKPITPAEEIDAVLKLLGSTPPPGKKPTQPLCYGGWMPLGLDDDYGRKYARLYAELGFRSLHPAHSGPKVLENLQAAGVPPTKSWMVTGYRNPPLAVHVEQAKDELKRTGLGKQLLWYDYGDEIAFPEWLQMAFQADVDEAKAAGKPLTREQVLTKRWLEWLRANRGEQQLGAYWLEKWGVLNLGRMRPDGSAAAARANPRLYVDSRIFYEKTAIEFVADEAKKVRAALGNDVRCGAGYPTPPFDFPHTAAYVQWFRGGAADFGGCREALMQGGPFGPMVNGYVAEHFRSGMRENPRTVLRPCVLPRAPGGTDADLLRTAFTQLAHGATALDFSGVGMNETFAEQYIDHRDHARYRALRDVTHAVGLVEDLLPHSRPLRSPVALLVSDSTERWDLAGVAEDQAGFGPGFRKVRLHHHLERLGLWTALTFLGASPDLLLEEDVSAKGLQDYKVLVVVGDCLPPALAPILETWVRGGGVLLAAANAGRYDPYREPTPAFQELFGFDTRRSEERTTFLRPPPELALLEPLDKVKGDGWEMPQLATFERIGPAGDTRVLARFQDDDSAAVVERPLGKGRVVYVAALPGIAYLWSAHQTPTPSDTGARVLLRQVLQAAKVEAAFIAGLPFVDARLLKAPNGYLLPLANYGARVGKPVTLRLRLDDPIGTVTSAYHGVLKVKQEKGEIVLTLPALGHGDVLRLDPPGGSGETQEPSRGR